MINVTQQLLDYSNSPYPSGGLSPQVWRRLRAGYYVFLFLATACFGPLGWALLWLGSIMFVLPSRSRILVWRLLPISGRAIGRVLWMQYLGFALIAGIPGLMANTLIRPLTPLSDDLFIKGVSLCIVTNIAIRALVDKWDARSGVPDGASWGRSNLVANMQSVIMGGIEIGLLLASGHFLDEGPRQVFQFDTVSLYVMGLMVLFAHVIALFIFPGVPAWFSKRIELNKTKHMERSKFWLRLGNMSWRTLDSKLTWKEVPRLKGMYAVLPMWMGVVTVSASVCLIYVLRDNELCIWLPIVPGALTMGMWHQNLVRRLLVIGCLPIDITRMILALELTVALLFVVPFGVFALVFDGPSALESISTAACITLIVSGCVVAQVTPNDSSKNPQLIIFLVGLLGGMAYGVADLGEHFGYLAPTTTAAFLEEARPVLFVVLVIVSPVWCAGLFLVTFFWARDGFMDVRLGAEKKQQTTWGGT